MPDIKVLTHSTTSGRKQELNLQPVLDGKTEMTGFPVDASGNYLCTLTYNESTRTVTITPTGSTFDIFVSGTKYTFTGAQSIQHGTQQGAHYIYFDLNGTLVTGQTPWDILLHVPVCYVFRDAVSNLNIAWEGRHHAGRDVYWHRNQHYNEGTKIRSGFTAAGYVLNSSTSNADITYSIDSGIVEDEDISVTTEALSDNGPYTILRRTGATGDWVVDRSSTVPLLLSGLDVAYNNFTGGVWTLTAAGQNQYVNYYVFAATALPSTSVTPSTKNQILIVPGQAVHTSLTNANAEIVSSISWGDIPFQEVAPLYKVTFIRNTGYTTTGRCRIAAIARIVGTYAQLTATAQSNHGALSGLTNDDHPHYPILSSGAVAPATTPDRIGALYVDTAEPNLYVGKGASSSADWFRVMASRITTFTGSGDFTLLPTTRFVRVILIGAGGGGGSGGTSGAGVVCTGGAGGGGAGKRDIILTRAEVLAAYPTGIVPISIGAGGTAGASVTSAGALIGNAGGQGGNTTFGTLATAYGGGGGGAGYGTAANAVGGAGGSQRAKGATASSTSSAGGGGGGTNGAATGVIAVGCGSGGGGSSPSGGAGGAGVFACDGGVGAAAGGGIGAGNATNIGGAGGPRFGETTGAAYGSGGASGTAGTAGAAPAAGGLFGQGGGGGGSGNAGAGGAGGAGGRGSGGGGGGAARSTYATGAGGVGGDGWALVLEF